MVSEMLASRRESVGSASCLAVGLFIMMILGSVCLGSGNYGSCGGTRNGSIALVVVGAVGTGFGAIILVVVSCAACGALCCAACFLCCKDHAGTKTPNHAETGEVPVAVFAKW